MFWLSYAGFVLGTMLLHPASLSILAYAIAGVIIAAAIAICVLGAVGLYLCFASVLGTITLPPAALSLLEYAIAGVIMLAAIAICDTYSGGTGDATLPIVATRWIVSKLRIR